MSRIMGDMELALALRLEGTTGAASGEVERLVAVSEMVATLPDPEIDPVFAAKLEQRLLTEGLASTPAVEATPAPRLQVVRPAPAQPAPAPVREERVAPNVITLPRRRYVMRKALVAGIAAALAMAMPIAMASTALPGTAGYPIKEARRAVQLHFANGLDKAFTMEHHAREYLGEAEQLVAIGAPTDLISDTLAKAGKLQALAAKLIIRSGSPELIAKLRSMIERDGDLLRTMLPEANGSHHDVAGAIANVETLSDALARAMGAVLGQAEPAPVIAKIADEVSTSSRSSAGSSEVGGSSARKPSPSTPGAPKAPVEPPCEGEGCKPATPGGCSTIGEAWFGNTLQAPSELLCAGSENQGAQAAE